MQPLSRLAPAIVLLLTTSCGGDGPTEPEVSLPSAPTLTSAVAGNAQITLSFSVPSDDGGAAITQYIGSCAPSGAAAVTKSGTASPIVVDGLTNGTEYSCSVKAKNSTGEGAASSSLAARPVTVPSAPTSVVATAGEQSASVAFGAPNDGGSAITGYSVTCAASGSASKAGTGTTSPIPVTGMTAGVQYSCTVTATNAVGTSATSAAATVTPLAPGAVNCGYIQASIEAYKTENSLGVTCDGTYAYFSTYGIQTKHQMMNGITQTILQVPIHQNFTGTNAWRLPINPTPQSGTKTSAVDGPIGIAVNGIPLFNPCKQGGCEFGDTKALGELDLCNGHAGRADDYHYHAAPVCMMSDQASSYWNTHPLGWALDGYGIFGYGNPDGSTPSRDACGGNAVVHPNAPSGYAYHVTDVAPYILSCFHGVVSPDLAGQGGKFSPLREPPPSNSGGSGVSNMTLNATWTSLAIGNTTTLQWQKAGVTYQILYKRTSNLCWNFIFKTEGTVTQTSDYCRAF
jgi:hypothetical protein